MGGWTRKTAGEAEAAVFALGALVSEAGAAKRPIEDGCPPDAPARWEMALVVYYMCFFPLPSVGTQYKLGDGFL